MKSLFAKFAAYSGLFVAVANGLCERSLITKFEEKFTHPPKGTLGLSWL